MIVHSYFQFAYPNQITREDIDGIMGEASLPWHVRPFAPFHASKGRCSCTANTVGAIWSGARAAFAVLSNTDCLCLTVWPDGGMEDVAFMSEARSALSKRLGIEWVNYEDEDES